VLSVKDNGAGLTKEVLEKIFEPFFTTKETGKGVGLGLATLFGIVSQNGGYIDVISKPNTGTTFLLYFPDRADTNPQNSEPSELNAPTLPETSHSHSILVVEDEPGLNRMIREMLEALHYTVYSSTDPVAAITLFKEHQETIDILLTDVVMPKQNGKELAETIKKLKPSIKVAFMSGYTADIIAHHGVLEDGYNYIQKPFTLKTLSELISQLTQDSPA
jgi:CheY-like chemotaxis protein